MEGKLLTITGDMAHFKNSRSAVLQQTYKIPPISTIVGILKNIYGKDIKDFVFGYNFKYDFSQYEISTIYKEVNMNTKKNLNKERFITNPCQVEYLINPKLEIVVLNIKNNYEFKTMLNLGKTNCLAKVKIDDIQIIEENILQEDIITDAKDGTGIIERQNIETVYNEDKGLFDYYTKLIRINDEYECKYSYNENGIYLWKYNGVGDIECYNK